MTLTIEEGGAKGANSVAQSSSRACCAWECANTDPAHARVRREPFSKKASDACMLEGSIMHKWRIAVLLAHLCFLNIVSVDLLNTFLLLNKSSHSRCLGPMDVRRLYRCRMVIERVHGPGGRAPSCCPVDGRQPRSRQGKPCEGLTEPGFGCYPARGSTTIIQRHNTCTNTRRDRAHRRCRSARGPGLRR